MYFGTPLVILMFGTMLTFFFVLVTGRRVRIKNFLGSMEVGSQWGENHLHRTLPGVDRQMIEGRHSSQQEDEGALSNNHPENSGGTTNSDNYHSANAGSYGVAPSNCGASNSTCGVAARTITPCCSASPQLTCTGHHPVSHGCAGSHSLPCQGLESPCHSRGDSRRFSPRDTSRENFGNSLRNRISNCASGDAVRKRQQPFRDVTARLANNNVSDVTRGWADENRSTFEEITITRRRKLSF